MAYSSESMNPFRLTCKSRNPVFDRTLHLTSRLMERASQLDRLTRLYQDAVKDSESHVIPEKVLQALHVTCEISDADVQRIPKKGPVVVVANHPLGAIENLVLLSAVFRVRSDAKVMANHLVACIPEIRSLCIFVDPYGQSDSKTRNVRPMMECVRWLKRGGLLIVFPAGDVSGVDLQNRRIADSTWSETIASLIRITEAQVVPAYFEEQRLLTSDNLQVYYAFASQIPELLREIGRLRELTFCAAGEGTGRLLDLDRFDAYYFHLFLWNDKSQELVGAYRFGLSDEIVRRFGCRGFYTNTLFKYGKRLLGRLDPAIELGRSFVRPEYQRAYAPLMLLWKGIGQFVVRNPRYRYLFGPVSMSREYNAYSRHLLAAFLQLNSMDADKARVIRARNPPRPVVSAECTPQTFRELVTDLDALSELIEEIEPDRKRVPVLLRQYLKLGGRILAFNVDTRFSQVLDALMAIDIEKINSALLARFMTPEGAASYLAVRAEDRAATKASWAAC